MKSRYKDTVICVYEMDEGGYKVTSSESIHLIIEVGTINRAAILYCFADGGDAAITVEQLADFMNDKICPNCLAAYQSVNPKGL